ncbi:microtubule-associated protein 9 [Fukomys damarensis]|uniref:microtubule-associated protein 9 n=1 Tax=Fukomys damarensis TaxID=885580 RepID=UPI00053F3ADC|nr:microtubule-associated protein 9 [Fukomys damarensis]XP_010626282.1 microtubule-associated protein 9 [Fukomys damarensis]
MADEVFSTTLAYTKSPKVTKRTTFQDELIRVITARSARQRSSEYSDDFESDVVSLGDFSDTSVDENLAKKKMNDFHISDDEEENSPRPCFLKRKKSDTDVSREEPEAAVRNSEERAPDVCGDVAANSFSESHNKYQEVKDERIKIKPKPRILPIKSTSSAENSSPETDARFKPSPRPRSMFKKRSHVEEKEKLGKEKETTLGDHLELAPSFLPGLSVRPLEAEKDGLSVSLDVEDPLFTESLSSSTPKESLGQCFPAGSEDKAAIKDQNGEFTENHDSLKLNENAENAVLVDCVTPELEKPTESDLAAADPEEEKRKGGARAEEDITAAPLLSKSQRTSVPVSAVAPAQKAIEDRNMKSKKSTPNNRASSASARLMTSEFVRKSGSAGRTPWPSASSHCLGTLKVSDQKPSQKQNLEPDSADHIRAAVYQEWLEKKNVYLHNKNRIKRIESENLRIQNEQKKAAKREEAIASFEAWKAMKEKEAKKLAAKKRLEEKNKRKAEEEENAARKGEALQAFEKWKEKKLEYLKEKNKKEKEYERAKKRKEEETVAEKKKENLTAVEKWNEKKEALFKQRGKEKINERRMEELKRAEKNDKDKQAVDQYEKWLEKKERQERIQRKQKKRHVFLESEDLPPWSPPRTVVSKMF